MAKLKKWWKIFENATFKVQILLDLHLKIIFLEDTLEVVRLTGYRGTMTKNISEMTSE